MTYDQVCIATVLSPLLLKPAWGNTIILGFKIPDDLQQGVS